MRTKKEKILRTAIESFKNHTGLEAGFSLLEKEEQLDSQLAIQGQLGENQINGWVRSVINDGHLPQLLAIQEQYPNFIVIAGRINKELKKTLQSFAINYLESGGNAFIKTPTYFIFIDGKKSGVSEQRQHLFTNTSIQLIFHLLIQPDLLHQTYRQIAQQTGIGLDTISKTIKILKQQNYILPSKQKKYVFSDKKGLINRWIPEYGDRLKEKLFIGCFRFLKNNNWQDLQFDTKKTRWGGEPAADLLLHHLKPQDYTIYSLEQKQDLIKNYRLIPDPKGNIYAYAAFWNMQQSAPSKTIPELLIYADLLLSKSARNIEIAKQLWDEHTHTFL